jgi:Domain of unknown function (DUF4142)
MGLRGGSTGALGVNVRTDFCSFHPCSSASIRDPSAPSPSVTDPIGARPRTISPSTASTTRQVLDAVDKTLIPSATNAELKALLEKVRPAFVAHLTHAKELQASPAK